MSDLVITFDDNGRMNKVRGVTSPKKWLEQMSELKECLEGGS